MSESISKSNASRSWLLVLGLIILAVVVVILATRPGEPATVVVTGEPVIQTVVVTAVPTRAMTSTPTSEATQRHQSDAPAAAPATQLPSMMGQQAATAIPYLAAPTATPFVNPQQSAMPAPCPSVEEVRRLTGAPVVLVTTESCTFSFSSDTPAIRFAPVGFIATFDIVPDSVSGGVELVIGGNGVSRNAATGTYRYAPSFTADSIVRENPYPCQLLHAEQSNSTNAQNPSYRVFAFWEAQCPVAVNAAAQADTGDCPAYSNVSQKATAQTTPVDNGGCTWKYDAAVGLVNIQLLPGDSVDYWTGEQYVRETNEGNVAIWRQAGEFTIYPAR